MGLKLANYVQESCNNPGTGTFALAGAATGRRSFAQAFSTGASVFYFADDGTQYECGIGTFTAGSPNHLARTTILETSSGGTSALNFTGTIRVFCEQPASALMSKDDWLFAAGSLGLRVVFPGITGTSGAGPGGGVFCIQFGSATAASGGQTYAFDRVYSTSAICLVTSTTTGGVVGTVTAVSVGGFTARFYTTSTGAAVASGFWWVAFGY